MLRCIKISADHDFDGWYHCAGVAAGLAADEEGGEEGGWGAEADLGLDDDGEPRDEFHDAEAGGEEGRALLATLEDYFDMEK
jgi:hypothetical protein